MRDYQSSPLWRIKRMLGEAKYCVSRLKGRSILGDIFEQALTYFTIAALAAAAAKAPCSCSENALFCASICFYCPYSMRGQTRNDGRKHFSHPVAIAEFPDALRESLNLPYKAC